MEFVGGDFDLSIVYESLLKQIRSLLPCQAKLKFLPEFRTSSLTRVKFDPSFPNTDF